MKTTVVGSWHLASIYAAGLATLGHDVGLVARSDVVAGYRAGMPPVLEPGLKEALGKHQAAGTWKFSDDINNPSNAAEVCFLAEDVKVVPSGVDLDDFRKLFDAVASSGNFNIICISSQMPIGTCRELQAAYPDIRIAHFPEFLRLGEGLARFLKPDYIVLGGEKETTAKIMAFFDSVASPKFEVTLEEAEMAKHAANIAMALMVSFISELTKFSERFNVNLERVGEILRCDARIGPKAYVLPGMGFSGETVERDIRVLLEKGRELGIDLPLLAEIIPVNNEHNRFIERELKKRISNMRGARIGFLGVTYKPVTSTLRGSLFTDLMVKLASEGAAIRLLDPHVKEFQFLAEDADEVFRDADAVVIAVGKKEFRDLDFGKLVATMKRPVIIDAANFMARAMVEQLKVEYASIGRGMFGKLAI